MGFLLYKINSSSLEDIGVNRMKFRTLETLYIYAKIATLWISAATLVKLLTLLKGV